MEACWAHNPEVRRSKLRSAIIFTIDMAKFDQFLLEGSVAERLRRWFKAPVSSGAWVRIPPLPKKFCQKLKGDTRI